MATVFTQAIGERLPAIFQEHVKQTAAALLALASAPRPDGSLVVDQLCKFGSACAGYLMLEREIAQRMGLARDQRLVFALSQAPVRWEALESWIMDWAIVVREELKWMAELAMPPRSRFQHAAMMILLASLPDPGRPGGLGQRGRRNLEEQDRRRARKWLGNRLHVRHTALQ